MAPGVGDHLSRLGDRYELTEVIGQGGMAVVWLARDSSLERRVAAKILPADRNDPTSQRRFYREARHVASLSHPNIVRIFDFGADDDRSFIIMEYVPGASLRSVLSSRSRLSVAETCRVGVDALAALEHAHERGIVHRDVKPGNLLIGEDGRIKVTDFGIARGFEETSELTQGGTFLGTVSYASPEQLAGEEIGTSTDLYSLGCVLYQCLNGRPPFESEQPDQLAMQHRFAAAPVPDAFEPTVPDPVAQVISRSLAKSPRDRPVTARAMAEALEPFAVPDLSAAAVRGGSGASRDDATEVATPPRRGRLRTLVWVSAAVVMVAAVLGVSLLLISGTGNQPATSQLRSGNLLAPGQALTSPDGRFRLIMQRDGNLVAYRTHPKTAVWESNTSGYLGAYLVMQVDGNLVLYPFGKSGPAAGKPSPAIWCSGTDGHPGAGARFLDNARLEVRSTKGAVLWAAPRDPSGCAPST